MLIEICVIKIRWDGHQRFAERDLYDRDLYGRALHDKGICVM